MASIAFSTEDDKTRPRCRL